MFAKLKSIREEQESGFTLIELLVVILIIGILAAIAIPMFMNQRKSAVDSSVQSDLKNAVTQIESALIKQPDAAKVVIKNVTATGADVCVNDGLTPVVKETCTPTKLSSGTVLTVSATEFNPSSATTGYSLIGKNPGGDQSVSTGTGITYSSIRGGLGK